MNNLSSPNFDTSNVVNILVIQCKISRLIKIFQITRQHILCWFPFILNASGIFSNYCKLISNLGFRSFNKKAHLHLKFSTFKIKRRRCRTHGYCGFKRFASIWDDTTAIVDFVFDIFILIVKLQSQNILKPVYSDGLKIRLIRKTENLVFVNCIAWSLSSSFFSNYLRQSSTDSV